MGFFKKASAGKSAKRKGNLPEHRDGKKTKTQMQDEEILSSDDDVDEEEKVVDGSASSLMHEEEDSGAEYEDAKDKTAREARLLLEAIKQVEGEQSEDEVLKEPIRVKKARRCIAETVRFNNYEARILHKQHLFSPVCIALSSDDNIVVSCSKDGSIVKYNMKTSAKCGVLCRRKKDRSTDICHVGKVSSCVISPNDKYLVSGGHDSYIKVWNLETLEHIKDFKAHKSEVTSLTFRKDCESLELFSASTDRSVKAWNLDQMGFVDTMYGHQDVVQDIDILNRPRVLTCGGQDKTVRLFKVAEESQLVFNAYEDCMAVDTVAMIDEEHFISGAMDGLYVWSISKKKPVCAVKEAHGRREELSSSDPNWICSVAAYPYTDLVATGSCDGKVKLWKVSIDYKSIKLIDEFEMKGFINDIRFSNNGGSVVCAVGQEHKNGRWWRIKEAKNSIVLIPLKSV